MTGQPAEDRGAYIMDIASGETQKVYDGLGVPEAFLKDGTVIFQNFICIGCDAGTGPLVALDTASGAATPLAADHVAVGVSPSGAIVAATSNSVATFDTGGQQLKVLEPTDPEWQYNSFAWSPDGSRLAYIRSHSTGTRFFEVNSDGSGFQQTAYNAGNPQLSPDGRRIAYLKPNRHDNGETTLDLSLANADGSGASQAIVSGTVDSLSWAPDSARVFFTAFENQPQSLYVVDADGGGLRKLKTVTPGLRVPGTWSPNSKFVVFPGEPITVLDVDTGQTTSVALGNGVGELGWSPDSTKLVYPVANSQSGDDINITTVDGGATTQIAGDNNQLFDLAVSPDGSKIAYIRSRSSGGDIAVTNVDGDGNTVVLSNGGFGARPVWSPDGQWLAMTGGSDQSSGVYVVHPDGSGAQELVRSQTVAGISWTSNGRLRIVTYLGGL